MGRKKKIVEEVVEVEAVEIKEVQHGDNIEFHLDRDLNDPRNVVQCGPLPSLND